MAVDNIDVLGIIGLLFIVTGILIKNKNRKKRDILYILGGLSMVVYSFYLNNVIFIILQIVFVIISIYDLNNQIKK